MLSTKEKKNMVVDLLDKGFTLREIAKSAHVSFSYVGKIRKRISGELADEKENAKPLSIHSQAFELFLDGKSPVEVAIALDLKTEEVIKLFNDFLALQNMHKVAVILKDYKKNLGSFLKWFDCINKYKINSKDLSLAIRYVINRNFQLKQKEDLEKEIGSLIDERDYLREDIKDIKAAVY